MAAAPASPPSAPSAEPAAPKGAVPRYPARRFFRTRSLGAWDLSPDGRRAAVVTNLTGVPELWLTGEGGGWPRQLTFDGQSIGQVAWSPDGRRLAYLQDRGGNECHQVMVLPSEGGEPAALTARPDRRHLGLAWAPDSKSVYYASNHRNPKYFHLYRCDLKTGRETELLKNDVEGDAGVAAVSKDGRWLVWVIGQTNLRQELRLLDLRTGEQKDLTPGPECTVHAPCWVEREAAVYFLTNHGADTHGIARVEVPSGTFRWARRPGRRELAGLELSPDGRSMVWIENRDGWLDAFLLKGGRRRALRPAGAGRGASFGPVFSKDGRRLALGHAGPTRPHELHLLDLGKGAWTRLTDSGGAVPAAHLVTPKLLRWKGEDGTPLSGFLYLPRGARGPQPLLVWPHGGPEAQETAEYRARHQFWANHGLAVFAPNFRGSTGFGKRFQRLIYKDWGGGHYKDVTSGVRELTRRGLADPARVGVYGGSFGGYSALWAVTQDPELWRAAVAVVAPSNLKTLIESTHPSWRRWAKELIGDPDLEPDLVRERSPLRWADRVRTPLMLFQGANDPRVPRAEADQFVEALRRHAIPCEYVVFEDEGHGWRTLERVFEEMDRSLAFLRRHLLDGGR